MTYISIYLVIQAAFFAAFAWLSYNIGDNFSYELVKKFAPGKEDKFIIKTEEVVEFVQQHTKVSKYMLLHTIAKLLSKGSLILALIIYLCSTLSTSF